MRKLIWAVLVCCVVCISLSAKVTVFMQDGFPTVASQPVSRATLTKAFDGEEIAFVDLAGLRDLKTLEGTDVLVLPYGSAFPADAWSTIRGYLYKNGNLLILGGQPFRVPVSFSSGKFEAGRAQDSYAKEVNFRNTYEVPVRPGTKFTWKNGYSFLGDTSVRGRHFFTVEGGVDGLGFMMNSDAVAVAAPVIVSDFRWVEHSISETPSDAIVGGRIVALDFEPESGYWESNDGVTLVRAAATYARQGATSFWLETQYSTIKPNEPAEITIRVRNSYRDRNNQQPTGTVKLELVSGNRVLESAQVAVQGRAVSSSVAFHKALQPGFYVVRGTYESDGKPREFYQNGFWVEDESLLASGPLLGVNGDFLTRDGKPFFPFGTNHFTSESHDWDFSSARNAAVWETDFAEMEKHGVTFVRTGVWVPTKRFVEPVTNGVNERFLRNLEAYLLSARRHNIIVNFTFFAFTPNASSGGWSQGAQQTVPNPYLDVNAVRAEQDYVVSIVSRFKNVPYLSWDLINEPSFSNPRRLWKGNTPNGDPAENTVWHKWLKKKYATLAELGSAWSVSPEELKSFDAVPLPSQEDLAFDRYGNANRVRAFDYNLFAQEMFADWVRSMVSTIRSTGSKQLINVGQDEGGVTDRVLNQFYADAGVAFTTNHTYWKDDALLWDSIAAKRPGMPNITGETGYQPVWAPDGTWRYDETTGYNLTERKWAMGFAAGSSGALQWDWAREFDFGMKRSDYSAKSWQFMMRDMGQFAAKAAPFATGFVRPQVAIVLPQSLQLSINNAAAVQAQQYAVRALYYYARAEAFAVGEYQLDRMGSPKLIIVPSPWVMNPDSLNKILEKVREGATLLVSGAFDLDPHFHATELHKDFGLDYTVAPLLTLNNAIHWAGGEAYVRYGGERTTYLSRAVLADGTDWKEVAVGKGRVLFSALPLELSENVALTGEVYSYAVKKAGVAPTYSTALHDHGIVICPTRFPHATLYVVSSESTRQPVSFTDLRSGKEFTSTLDAGRSALLLIGDEGQMIASYNWNLR